MKKFMRVSLCVVAVPLFTACSPAFLDVNKLQADLGIDKPITQAQYPEANAVVIMESHDIELDFDNNFRISTYENVHVIKKVFKNFDDEANVEIVVESGQKLSNIEARTITPDGRSIPVEKKEFHEIRGSGDNEIFYSDSKTVKFTFKSVERDAILEYHYKIRNDFAFFDDVWYIQHNIPVIRNMYTLHVPKILLDNGWNWIFKPYNYNVGLPALSEPPKGSTTQLQMKKTFQWVIKDIPAFEYERRMPPSNQYRALVRFSSNDWKTWNDVASWYSKSVFLPQLVPSEVVNKKAHDLVAGKSENKDKIKALLDYVKNMRYVAIELGIGGITPVIPQKVFERQYGDCKDKSTLLISMIRSVGIPADPVLVLSANAGMLDPSFPCWRFNHMIVKTEIGDKVYWIDPTAATYDLGELPWTDEGIYVLVANENSDKLEITPASNENENLTDINIKVTNMSKTKTNFDVSIGFHGEEYNVYQWSLKNKSEQDLNKMCRTVIADQYVSAELNNVQMRVDTTGKTLYLNFSFTVSDAITQQADLYFLNQDPYKLFEDWNWLIYDKRKYPIDLKYPYTMHKTIDVNLNSAFAVRNLPKSQKLATEHLYYNRQIEQASPSHWTCRETFSTNNAFITSLEYSEVKSFFQKVKSGLDEKTVLIGSGAIK
jgi:transglutaminase-like putative cysteine protease